MYEISRKQCKPGTPIKYFRGKCSQTHSFGPSSVSLVGGSGTVLVAMLVLGFSVCGFSVELSMVSIPLGFQISGHDKTTWVSENGVFAFGFLGDNQEDDGFVVGIWHNFRNSDEKLPVWTVGGGVRVCENSTFQLSLDGSLILFDGSPKGLPVWSSNTGNLGVLTASLLNNGNLVLMDLGHKVIWESFNSPTDTLLPGQSLHFPQSLQASSTNSIASYYRLGINSSGDISLVWENNVTYWSSHLSSPIVVKEAKLEPNGLFGIFDASGGAAWYRLSEDFSDPSVVFRRLRMDADGNLRIYSWDNVSSTWKVGWQAVQNQCDVFGSCGLYNVCTYNSAGPVCECLYQDPVTQECEKMADLGNCETGVGIMVLKQTILYSLYPPHDVDTMLSLEACKDYCSNDSSCVAATAKNDGSGLCTIKRTSFISGYRYSSVQATTFLKVCLVPQAVSARAANLHESARIPLPVQQSVSQIVARKKYIVAIAILLLITGSIFLTVEMFLFWFVIYRRQINTERRTPFGKDARMNPHYSALVRLSLEELKELTKNFANKLGPSVYKGILPNKIPVSIKVLDEVVASERNFQMVVSSLGSTHHRNLVALKGFCFEPEQKLLVYEYISNGSLDQWLFNRRHNRSRDNWNQRLNVAIGIARAIAYLHLECKQCIAHGNLKLENVLLDENLVAKVTDFGLQGLSRKNIASSSETLPERDVYMFGGVLLQIVAGKKDIVEDKLYDLAYEMCRDEVLGNFVDVQLEGRFEQEGLERVVKLALWCMQDQPTLRPSIGEVVMVLEGALSLDMPPKSEPSNRGRSTAGNQGGSMT